MNLSTKRLCRSGIIAAAYAALTLAFAPVAYGPIQIRPAEALTILPLFFIESVPALFIGCLIANLLSPYGMIDIVMGSLTTLLAAIVTYYIGKVFKKYFLKIILGGFPPVILNAVILPIVWAIAGGTGAFFANFFPILITQIIFVYALGMPLYYSIISLQKKGNRLFMP
jgi:uncharacterized membrane protein